LVEHAEEVLHVMSVLVRSDVRLDKRRDLDAEPRPELVEEPEVDVDELVLRTVERPDLRGRDPAARVRLVGEEDGVRIRVLLVAVLEHAGPELLHAVHDTHDAAVVALVRVLAGAAGGEMGRRADRRRAATLSDGLAVERRELSEGAAAA